MIKKFKTNKKFKDWVYKNGGPTAIARKLKTDRRMIYNWIEGKNHPSLNMFVKILTLTNGELTINDFANRN